MDQELSKKLNECGIKKSIIEIQLKMPKNSLAGMMNGTRPTPDKWAKKLQEYVDTLIPLRSIPLKSEVIFPDGSPEELFTKMQAAFKEDSERNWTPEKEAKIQELKKDVEEGLKLEKLFETGVEKLMWVKLIEDYCGVIGMTPEELIADHKRMFKMTTLPVLKIKEDSNKVIVNDLNEQAKPKGGYNPLNHPKYSKLYGEKGNREG